MRRCPIHKLNAKTSNVEGYGQSDFGAITPSDVAQAAFLLTGHQYDLIRYLRLLDCSRELFDRIVRSVLSSGPDFVDRDGKAWRLGKGQIRDMIEVAITELRNPKALLKTQIYDYCGFSRESWYKKNRPRYALIYNHIQAELNDGLSLIAQWLKDDRVE